MYAVVIKYYIGLVFYNLRRQRYDGGNKKNCRIFPVRVQDI